MRRSAAYWKIAVSILILTGCGRPAVRRGVPADAQGAVVAAEMVAAMAPSLGDTEVAWLGVRNEQGMRATAGDAVGEHILSALLRQGIVVSSVDTTETRWRGELPVPAAAWEVVSAPVVIGGRMHQGGEWAYLRLLAVETQDGRVRSTSRGRLPLQVLEQLAVSGLVPELHPDEPVSLELSMQLVVTRVESGTTRQLDLEEGGSLLAGDRLQLRFTLSRASEVYAFLVDSDGEQQPVFGSEMVYSGREVYGPGRESWVTLQEQDRVYTLYVVAGSRLSADRSDVWRQIAELIEQGQVDRFAGLELQDQVLEDYVRRELPADAQVTAVRGTEPTERGQPRNIILADGTRLVVRPHIIPAQDALVWAISFLVQ